MSKRKHSSEAVDVITKKIRSSVFNNLEEDFRVQKISEFLNMPREKFIATKSKNSTDNWVWTYSFDKRVFKSIGEIVEYVMTTEDENLNILADAAASHSEKDIKPIFDNKKLFESFNKYITRSKYPMPVSEFDLLELLRKFAADEWINIGDINDIKEKYPMFKTIYLIEHFTNFMNS